MDMFIMLFFILLLGYFLYDSYISYLIRRHSSRYLELVHITQRYMDSVRKHPLKVSAQHSFDSKQKFDNDNNQAVLLDNFLHKNKIELSDIVESANYNKGLADYYEDEVKEKLMAIPPSPKHQNKELSMLRSLFHRVNFTKPFTLTFKFSYRSPKGQNYYENIIELSPADLAERLRQLEEAHVKKSEYEVFRDAERSKMTAGLRYDILKRDQFMCQICGADASTHGVTLHVDHIKPVAKWGKTEEDNLQTLCRDCNLGKGVKL